MEPRRQGGVAKTTGIPQMSQGGLGGLCDPGPLLVGRLPITSESSSCGSLALVVALHPLPATACHVMGTMGRCKP